MTLCVWPALHVTAARKEVCFRQNCSSPAPAPLPACREGLDHDQVQALGHFVPPAHGSSLRAGRARHRRAWSARTSVCKLAGYSVWKGHRLLRAS